MTPPAKRLTRSPACWASVTPAVPRSSEWPKGGTPLRFHFRASFLHDDRLLLSFSGLKTAVLYALHGQNASDVVTNPSPELVGDLAASFQEAVVDAVVAKTRQALCRTGLRRLGVGGGVAANSRLRQKLAEMTTRLRVELFIPPLELCTDNAAMAAIALPKLAAGQTADLSIDVTAGLVRPARPG